MESRTYSNLGLYEDIGKKFPNILSILSSVLERRIQKSEKLLKSSGKKDTITIFHGSKAPGLSIRTYIERIFKYSNCSPSCFVVAYIYIERYLRQTDGCLSSLNIHRLLITTILLAAKFIDDECYNNAYYAKVGGISTSEMNKLEIKFLRTVDFRLHVTVETFGNYCCELGVREEETTVTAKKKSQIERPIWICGLRRKGAPRVEDHTACRPI